MEQARLTSFSHGAGCACKLGPADLAAVLGPLFTHPAVSHPNLMVGIGTSDDSGVYVLGDDRALVQTVDFFTPIVDDPRSWGRIAAVNALSDIYAMGAVPLTALQLLAWPRDAIPFEVAAQVIGGGADVMAEAGCVILGGHSIDDAEPKYGFAVTGLVETSRVVANAGAEPGDRLVITKPLGTGVVTTAHKADKCPPDVLAEAVTVMSQLNDLAGAALFDAGATAATDVTGFGLLGHLKELVVASGVGAVIDFEAVPFIDGVRSLHEAGFFPGGSRRNLEAVTGVLTGRIEDAPLLADAQTSGGLLVTLPPHRVKEYTAVVRGAVEIGEITGQEGRIEIR